MSSSPATDVPASGPTVEVTPPAGAVAPVEPTETPNVEAPVMSEEALQRAEAEILGSLDKSSDSVKVLRLAATAGEVDAQWALVQYCEQHMLPEEALEWARRASAQGFVKAHSWLGVHLDEGINCTANHVEAHRFYQLGAEAGDEVSMTNIATQYYKGQGTEPDIEKAIQWYERAAGKGVAQAMHRLGYIYQAGYPAEGMEAVPRSAGRVRPDLAKAVRWFEKAAEKSYPDSMFVLGSLLYEGVPSVLPPDQARAAELWEPLTRDNAVCDEADKRKLKGLAATALAKVRKRSSTRPTLSRARDARAHVMRECLLRIHVTPPPRSYCFPVHTHMHTQAYIGGHGVARDGAQGSHLLHMGALLGDPDAMIMLGILFGSADPARTLGAPGIIERDPQKSYAWFRRAADAGCERAGPYLARFRLAPTAAAAAKK
ncbi:putative sel1 repeat family protein [Paratrimastix pyriformis]|uniref:Sel1 repeat family protein n=1 Tax=Paratrimastix pyriformis TaxID=342808 RepID=A0ABQ8UR09_9EUKA|nr:putative sel1 repeat family protein [Paratrimastix pyriformis]